MNALALPPLPATDTGLLQQRLAALAAATPIGTGYTLGLWEAVPKFVLAHRRQPAEITQWETSFRFGSQHYHVRISPGLVRSDKESNRLVAIYPSAREDLVFRCLLEVHTASASLYTLKFLTPQMLVGRGCFNATEIRRILAGRGRHFAIPEIIESLHVLNTAHFTFESDGHAVESGYISNLCLSKTDGVSGVADLNPMATESLLRFTVWPVDNVLLMGLKRPLARWLMIRLFNRFRQASSETNFLLRDGYHLRLSTIGRESGILLEKRLRDTLHRVREALGELAAAGLLSRECPWTETEQRSRVGRTRQSAIVDVVFDIYPSWTAVDRIVAGNATMAHLRTAHRGVGDGAALNSLGFESTRRSHSRLLPEGQV